MCGIPVWRLRIAGCWIFLTRCGRISENEEFADISLRVSFFWCAWERAGDPAQLTVEGDRSYGTAKGASFADCVEAFPSVGGGMGELVAGQYTEDTDQAWRGLSGPAFH